MPILWRGLLAILAFIGPTTLAFAADSSTLRFWNMTAETINELYLAPTETTRWSTNLCLGDPDHVVDPDERLALPGIAPGSYDVRVVDAKHRSCTFHDIRLSGAGRYAFLLSENQMAACH